MKGLNALLRIRISGLTIFTENMSKMCESLVQHQETSLQGRQVEGVRNAKISKILKWPHIDFFKFFVGLFQIRQFWQRLSHFFQILLLFWSFSYHIVSYTLRISLLLNLWGSDRLPLPNLQFLGVILMIWPWVFNAVLSGMKKTLEKRFCYFDTCDHLSKFKR